MRRLIVPHGKQSKRHPVFKLQPGKVLGVIGGYVCPETCLFGIVSLSELSTEQSLPVQWNASMRRVCSQSQSKDGSVGVQRHTILALYVEFLHCLSSVFKGALH